MVFAGIMAWKVRRGDISDRFFFHSYNLCKGSAAPGKQSTEHDLTFRRSRSSCEGRKRGILAYWQREPVPTPEYLEVTRLNPGGVNSGSQKLGRMRLQKGPGNFNGPILTPEVIQHASSSPSECQSQYWKNYIRYYLVRSLTKEEPAFVP